jgi:hypothetical protein
MEKMNQLKKGQVWEHNNKDGMVCRITDKIITPEGPEYVGQVYWKFDDFTLLEKCEDTSRNPLQELVDLFDLDTKGDATGNRLESAIHKALGLKVEPTSHQVHWVRENRKWISKMSDGKFTPEEILDCAAEHARLLANGYGCKCEDPECGLAQVSAKFPQQ